MSTWRIGSPARRGARGMALALAVGLVAPHVAAQTDEDRAGARAAAGAGAQALRDRKWTEAVDFFTRAESLVHAPPHLLYLAEAQSQLGLLVKAHENLEKVTREHLSADAPPAFRDAQKRAEASLEKLETRMPYVTVNIDGSGGAQVAVTQDGKRISDALIGVPRPVDPGSHTFQAMAPGLQATATVDVKESAHENVLLKLAPAAPGVVTTPPPPPLPEATPAQTATSPAPIASTATPGGPQQPDSAPATGGGGGTNGLRIGSYVAFGVGAVGLGVGTVFLLSAGSKQKDSDQKFSDGHCGDSPVPSTCDQAGIQSLDSSASSARTLATVGFIAGGAGVATGVVLFILSNKKSQPAAANEPSIHPWVGLKSAGLVGTF
jgi:hypothetical protein